MSNRYIATMEHSEDMSIAPHCMEKMTFGFGISVTRTTRMYNKEANSYYSHRMQIDIKHFLVIAVYYLKGYSLLMVWASLLPMTCLMC